MFARKRNMMQLILVALIVLETAILIQSGEVCGGDEGKPCPESHYCQRPMGDCSSSTVGMCEKKNRMCRRDFRPVCGCDLEVYGNACVAASFGINVAHRGECEVDETTITQLTEPRKEDIICGGDSGHSCADGEYCHRRIGSCDGIGICQTLPLMCTMEWRPQCGCDGETYSNPCAAAGSGVVISYEVKCEVIETKISETSTPQDDEVICGGDSDHSCPENEYCHRPVGSCEGIGTCRFKPDVCTLDWNPQCGCDGKTYGNSCKASSKGIGVSYESECALDLDDMDPQRGNGENTSPLEENDEEKGENGSTMSSPIESNEIDQLQPNDEQENLKDSSGRTVSMGLPYSVGIEQWSTTLLTVDKVNDMIFPRPKPLSNFVSGYLMNWMMGIDYWNSTLSGLELNCEKNKVKIGGVKYHVMTCAGDAIFQELPLPTEEFMNLLVGEAFDEDREDFLSSLYHGYNPADENTSQVGGEDDSGRKHQGRGRRRRKKNRKKNRRKRNREENDGDGNK